MHHNHMSVLSKRNPPGLYLSNVRVTVWILHTEAHTAHTILLLSRLCRDCADQCTLHGPTNMLPSRKQFSHWMAAMDVWRMRCPWSWAQGVNYSCSWVQLVVWLYLAQWHEAALHEINRVSLCFKSDLAKRFFRPPTSLLHAKLKHILLFNYCFDVAFWKSLVSIIFCLPKVYIHTCLLIPLCCQRLSLGCPDKLFLYEIKWIYVLLNIYFASLTWPLMLCVVNWVFKCKPHHICMIWFIT